MDSSPPPPPVTECFCYICVLTSSILTDNKTFSKLYTYLSEICTAVVLRDGHTSLPSFQAREGCASAIVGSSSYVRPCSVRPLRFFHTPPHCLKKNGIPSLRH